MMAHKHLHELLKEDQEPFLLKHYIADRRSQLKTLPVPETSLQPKKPSPIVHASTSKRSLCNQACFFSFHRSPDARMSPFLDFPPPASHCKSPKTVLLHIPASTAALLLEAAIRIQKHSSSLKPKPQIKNTGFGLFGSILKRLSSRNGNRKCEIAGAKARKSAGKSEKVQENAVAVVVDNDRSAFEMGFSCSSSNNNSRRNSAVWSESNEEKSLDLETSCSSMSEEYYEELENGGLAFSDKHVCSSPLSPFRFALQTSPSPGRRTPVFSSPATSPSRHRIQANENCQVESAQKTQFEEEEEKEQCSPVSVLDLPFEDDEDGPENGEDGCDMECSYAIVERATLQLLQKLRRFEKLAELDPIELEKRMLEEQDDEDDSEHLEEEEENCDLSSHGEKNGGGVVRDMKKLVSDLIAEEKRSDETRDMKKLVSDLIAEEKRSDETVSEEDEVVVKKVRKRLDSWKEVRSNTIDMMVESDFRREIDGWKGNGRELVGETAMEIEISIFGLLVEELSVELVCLPKH